LISDFSGRSIIEIITSKDFFTATSKQATTLIKSKKRTNYPSVQTHEYPRRISRFDLIGSSTLSDDFVGAFNAVKHIYLYIQSYSYVDVIVVNIIDHMCDDNICFQTLVEPFHDTHVLSLVH
jgi:hypothetical protein